MARLPLVVAVLGGLLAACGAASPQGGRSRTGQGKGPKDLIHGFMAGASGPVLGRAKVPAPAAITPCYPITFSVRGKRMKVLIGSHVRGRLRQALGQKLP